MQRDKPVDTMKGDEKELYLSDDSSFYGDEERKLDLQARSEALDVSAWWAEKIPSLTEIASANIAKNTARDKVKLYNPYEGILYARQLNETVDEFLTRLPPATSEVSPKLPWIFIANPFIPRNNSDEIEQNQEDIRLEGPAHKESEWQQFIVKSQNLLDELQTTTRLLEKEMVGKPADMLATAITKEKDKTVKRMMEYAVERHCTAGKWMLFCQASEVNAVWRVVARATASNELGIAAKVAPKDVLSDPLSRRERLICVYTKDFTDMEDVTRVLRKLRNLGLCQTRGKPIYYKCDAYSHLGINSGNKWNIKASLYRSTDFLKPKDK